MASIAQHLVDIEEQVDHAVERVNADPGASPALQAVIAEFHAKARLARDETRGADERTVRDHVIEAEEAADAAKKAAEADENISDATRRAVILAHDAMCDLKGDLPD